MKRRLLAGFLLIPSISLFWSAAAPPGAFWIVFGGSCVFLFFIMLAIAVWHYPPRPAPDSAATKENER